MIKKDISNYNAEWMGLKDLKAYLSVGTTTLYKMRQEPDFPEGRKVWGRVIKWDRNAIDEWMSSRAGTRGAEWHGGKKSQTA